jgi:hypothetical protein
LISKARRRESVRRDKIRTTMKEAKAAASKPKKG